MQKNIANTLFYSFLFALGGAPTLAMLLIQAQPMDPDLLLPVLISLSVMVACVLLPIILLQNSYLIYKRHDARVEQRVKSVGQVYLVLNALCLAYWLLMQWH